MCENYASEIAGRSPALRAEIAGLTFGKTVRSVWYFIGVSDDFTAEVLPRKRSEAQSWRGSLRCG